MDDFNDEMLLEEDITFVHDINREKRINRRRRDAYYKNRRKKAVLHYQAVCYDTGRTFEWFFTEPLYPFKMNLPETLWRKDSSSCFCPQHGRLRR